MTAVADYHGWLHQVTNRVLGYTDHPDHDDLVQEGRIAMWRAEATHNPDLGAKPSWITRAAEMRMKDIAWSTGRWTGREATRGRREVESVHWDRLAPQVQDEVHPRTEDIAEKAMFAYHHGEIAEAIDSLPAPQRAAVLQFLRTGRAEHRSAWQSAKPRLAEQLSHLRGVA